MKKSLLFMLLPITLVGCTSTYHMDVLKAPSEKLQRSYSVSVQTPQNGSFGPEMYASSGRMTADAFKSKFSRYSSEVTVVPAGKTKDNFSGLSNTYYVEPEILHWEDRATEWSGKRDKIEIKVNIYDAASMNTVSSVIFTGKSKWMTFGGDHPQELLPKPVDDYLKTLY